MFSSLIYKVSKQDGYDEDIFLLKMVVFEDRILYQDGKRSIKLSKTDYESTVNCVHLLPGGALLIVHLLLA